MNYMLHRPSTRANGFTLLELLVVISIIGILIAMIGAAFSTAQSRSRDARRRGDIKAMQNAFEQYNAANNGSYDTGSTNCSGMTTSLPGGLPLDPQSGVSYTCTNTATTYCACALLEGSNTGNATNTTCGYGTGNYFCVSNLQ